jgi:S1-C subfamily serine protease
MLPELLLSYDGTVNYGNSGGPLMDCNGNVIGVDKCKKVG